MRAFIAIDLDPGIKARLDSFIGRTTPLSRGVKWVTLDSMHLTLKFLGEISEDQASRLKEGLGTLAARSKPIIMTCRGLGSFPPGSPNPRVLWAGVHAGPDLALLAEAIESLGEEMGFPREVRPFHPHLTLGRVKSPDGLRAVLEEFDRAREEAFGEMSAGRLTFFQSRLSPSGAKYNILGEFPFS